MQAIPLFQYSSLEELEQIRETIDDPNLAQCISRIQKGEWDDLIRNREGLPNLRLLLLAAHALGEISALNVGSAWFYMDVSQSFLQDKPGRFKRSIFSQGFGKHFFIMPGRFR
ncbi:MAG: hypothetical protein HKM07_05135 [Chlamydiae bacterium]|nr:hypothetical protein [Chlamydiota bacterium]